MTPTFETIEVEAAGPLGRLTLARPEKRNPLSTATLHELVDAARWFDTTEVRVVVVAGQGPSFCAGADLASFTAEGAGRAAADAGRRMGDAIEAMRATVIAAVHGWCVGGGVVLASACDLRVAGTGARFSIPEVDLGLPLAWGGVPRLVRDIGAARTKELVMTGRPFDAAEAERIGFVNRCVPDAELAGAVDELADVIGAKARYPVEATKAHVNAVTADMVGMARTWADADSLQYGLHDAEGREALGRYLGDR